MRWAMFLDDERSPKTQRDWVISRSYGAAVAVCEDRGCPAYISFDHDLGGDLTGRDFARWLIERDLDDSGAFIPSDFEFNVHSANVVGRANIETLLDQYLAQRAAQGIETAKPPRRETGLARKGESPVAKPCAQTKGQSHVR